MPRENRPWSPQDEVALINAIDNRSYDYTLHNAFKSFAKDTNRPLTSVRQKYYQLRKKGTSPVATVVSKPTPVHPNLQVISSYIEELEASNRQLIEQNEALMVRIAEMQSAEADLHHLVSIIERSRKEAFTTGSSSRSYRIVDGVPVFQS